MKIIANGVKLTPNTWIHRIGDHIVVVHIAYGNKEYKIESVDTVVSALGSRTNDSLSRPLRQAKREFYLTGDWMAPRNMEDATLEDHKVGRAVRTVQR